MCVIYACGTKLPPEDELRRGAFRNDDGAGVAWLQGKAIHWRKGLKDDTQVREFIEKDKIPFPLAIHFRTASVGGTSPELTHPFPVSEGIPLWLAGKGPEVLMHNGHLSNWEELTLQAALSSPGEVPEGAWSDTRALAYLVWLKGPGILRFVSQTSRVLLMHAEARWEPDFDNDPWVHFTCTGSWEGKREDGFIQSIKTDYTNRGGVITYGKRWEHMQGMDPDDSTPYAIPKVTAENVWTISELSQILVEMEKELEDARIAARA